VEWVSPNGTIFWFSAHIVSLSLKFVHVMYLDKKHNKGGKKKRVSYDKIIFLNETLLFVASIH
jgi:hypothetical protein